MKKRKGKVEKVRKKSLDVVNKRRIIRIKKIKCIGTNRKLVKQDLPC